MQHSSNQVLARSSCLSDERKAGRGLQFVIFYAAKHVCRFAYVLQEPSFFAGLRRAIAQVCGWHVR